MKPIASHQHHKFPGFALILFILLPLIASCDGKMQVYTGTRVDVLVVMLDQNKEPACPTEDDCAPWFPPKVRATIRSPRHTASEYVAILKNGINNYYQKATYGKVYFDFTLLENPDRSDGWWDSPYTLSDYNKILVGFMQSGITVAYRALGESLNDYDRILVISNIQLRGGQTCCVHKPTPYFAFPGWFEKVDANGTLQGYIQMIASEVNEDGNDQALITVTSHELGHAIGAPDEYYDGYVGMGTWDLMDQDSAFNHFGAWTKLDRGWLDWNANTTRMPCVAGSCSITTTLDPLESPGNNALLIPILNTPEFFGFMVECRKRLNGDENIPAEGALVTISNPYLEYMFSGTVSAVETNKANPYSVLYPGETYSNLPNHVSITNMSAPGEQTCTIKAERNLPQGPDLYITQGAIIESEPFDRYKSPDIWNDTDINGLYTYPPYEKITTLQTDSGMADVPAGYGDPVSTAVENRAMFMIHNGGNVEATNITVNVYLRQPLSVSVQTENCGGPEGTEGIKNVVFPKKIGSVLIYQLNPGSSTVQVVTYTTTSNSPLEIEVEIEPVDGELDEYNNIAYETYTQLYGWAGGNQVNNASKTMLDVSLSENCTRGVSFMVMEDPARQGAACNWGPKLEPTSGHILPGETVHFSLAGTFREDLVAGASCDSTFSVLMPVTDVFTGVESFDFQARVVEPAVLTCSTPDNPVTISTPALVTGKLEPALSDTILLLYTDPTGLQIKRNIQTSAGGNYQDGFTPTLTGPWTVQALWVGDEKHSPTESTLCRFTVAPVVITLTPTFTFTPTPVISFTPTQTPTPVPMYFTPNINTYCREGPDTSFISDQVAMKGQAYLMDGRNLENTWYRIMITPYRGCWVPFNTGTASGNTLALRVLLNVPTYTPTPVVDCTVYTDMDSCNAQPVCTWKQEVITRGYCVNK